MTLALGDFFSAFMLVAPLDLDFADKGFLNIFYCLYLC